MKKEIPIYKNKISLSSVYNHLSEQNKKIIQDFLNYCSITASQTTLNKIKNKIIIIADVIKKDLNKLTLKDLRDFLAVLNKSSLAISTQNDIKKVLKRFIKWKYKDWSLKFNQLKDAKANGNDKRKLSKSDLLTPDEMKIIIKTIESLKYKTIFLVLQETAGRPEEILKLKWRDINLDKKEIKLDSAKTGKTRFIPINKSASHLERYKLECFYTTPKADDYVFPNPHNPKKHLTNQALHDFLRKLERRLKFEKHLYPYIWRHSILSKMIKTLSPKVYELYAGHSLETGMRVYAHLDTEDLKQELYDKIYKIEKLTTEEKAELKKLEKEVEQLKKGLSQSLQMWVEVAKNYPKLNKDLKNKLKEIEQFLI